MVNYDPKIHHRKSIRLKGYDYSRSGLYFITICTQNREYLFGEIAVGADLRVCPNPDPNPDPKMILNDAGAMVEKWYVELENKFPDMKCHAMIVMPNHVHYIIENVGADLRVCPNNATTGETTTGEHVGSPLHCVVQWFKTMTTNEYIRGVKNNGWQRFDGKLWQRNYWEHIIRDENECRRIAEYIINNPKKWAFDKLNNDMGNQIMEPPTMYGQNIFCPDNEAWMV